MRSYSYNFMEAVADPSGPSPWRQIPHGRGDLYCFGFACFSEESSENYLLLAMAKTWGRILKVKSPRLCEQILVALFPQR